IDHQSPSQPNAASIPSVNPQPATYPTGPIPIVMIPQISGRSLTVDKKTLKDQRNLYEDRLLVRLAEILPPHLKVRIIADRGFGDHKLYRLLAEQLHFDYVIRFRGNIQVTAAEGETRTAASWVRPGGLAPCAAPKLQPSAMRWAPSYVYETRI